METVAKKKAFQCFDNISNIHVEMSAHTGIPKLKSPENTKVKIELDWSIYTGALTVYSQIRTRRCIPLNVIRQARIHTIISSCYISKNQ